MAIKNETFTATDSEGQEHSYEVNQMPGRKAMKAFKFWIGIIGSLTTDEDMMQSFIKNVDDDELIDNIELLLTKEVLRDGQPVKFDEDYRGNLAEAFQITVQILRFNFEGLWGSSLGKVLSGLK